MYLGMNIRRKLILVMNIRRKLNPRAFVMANRTFVKDIKRCVHHGKALDKVKRSTLK